ncbi:hypothetical protein ACVWZZ_001375 [Bradyrhizobium sp. LM6.10]
MSKLSDLLQHYRSTKRRAGVCSAIFQILVSSAADAETIRLRDKAIDLTGFPDATTTGVPPGKVLAASPGLVISTPGAVIEGLDITGPVIVEARDVRLQDCKVTHAGHTVIVIRGGITGTIIQNCEIDNRGYGGQCIAGQGTFLRNNIHDCADGIDVRGDNTLIEGNYIHQMTGPSDSHFDGVQADGKFSHLSIRQNTIINENTQTSAVMIDNYTGPIDDVMIGGNLLVGGGYTVYINEVAKGQPGGGPVTNVVFTNNQLAGGYWGPLDLRTELGNVPVISGNIDKLTGRPVRGPNKPGLRR